MTNGQRIPNGAQKVLVNIVLNSVYFANFVCDTDGPMFYANFV